MNIKRDTIILLALIGSLGLVFYFAQERGEEMSRSELPTPTSTTGESVSSNGSKSEPDMTTVTAKMNNPASGLGVAIEPLELVEDSRCPSDVVCIQAGTVRVRAKITDPNGERIVIMDLGMPLSSQYETVQLAEVLPEARSTIPIRLNEYRFIFEIRMQVRF